MKQCYCPGIKNTEQTHKTDRIISPGLKQCFPYDLVHLLFLCRGSFPRNKRQVLLKPSAEPQAGHHKMRIECSACIQSETKSFPSAGIGRRKRHILLFFYFGGLDQQSFRSPEFCKINSRCQVPDTNDMFSGSELVFLQYSSFYGNNPEQDFSVTPDI